MENLLPALRETSDHTLYMYFGDEAVAGQWRSRGLADTVVRRERIDNPILRLGVSLPAASRRDRLDVLLCHYNRPPLASCPVVTIVHDVSFARFPENFSAYERTYMNAAIPRSMRHSAAIVTDSEFSREEMGEVYAIPGDRITVAPHGVDPRFSPVAPETQPGAAVGPPFIFAVGSLQPRKNLRTLVSAYARLVERHPEVEERLVLTGSELGADALGDEAATLLRADRVVFTGHVEDDELARLYREATAFAYPSVYEGFGLPPLEAMASGTPVAVADVPVMREIPGEAALLVPATDVDAWADALWRLVSEPQLRERLAGQGLARAGRFTWERSARAITAALEAAAC
jgi:glycosyltransferase involved in cell wall biosynthesis